MKKVVVGLVTLVFSLPANAGAYRCTDPETGKVTYSQSPCAESKSEKIETTSNSSRDNEFESNGRSACFTAIQARLKDPESMKVATAGDMELKQVEYAGATILAYELSAFVNAKNSYGGCTGEKLWTCVLAQNDKSVLRVLPPE